MWYYSDSRLKLMTFIFSGVMKVCTKVTGPGKKILYFLKSVIPTQPSKTYKLQARD